MTINDDAPFGDYAVSGQPQIDLDEDTPYPAFVKSCRPVWDGDHLRETQDGKRQADVMFMIDQETSLRRRFTIAYGQNSQNKQWSAWAQFLEAATGVKCGDPSQRKLKPSDIEGQTVKIFVEKNADGYTNVTRIRPPGRKVGGDGAPGPVTRAGTSASRGRRQPTPSELNRNPFDDDPDD